MRRWFWWRRPAPPPGPPDAAEAVAARLRAEADLLRTMEQSVEVRELADQLRAHRRVNHFAELFGAAFERGGNR